MKYLYVALAICGAMILCFCAGVHTANNSWEAKDNDLRAKDAATALDLQTKLDAALNNSHTYTTTLEMKVPHVTEYYIQTGGTAPIARPTYYLTFGAVGLWNDALQGAGSAPVTDAAASSTRDLNLSAVSFEQAETNAVVNFGQYRECRVIVQGWQDWYKDVSTHH